MGVRKAPDGTSMFLYLPLTESQNPNQVCLHWAKSPNLEGPHKQSPQPHGFLNTVINSWKGPKRFPEPPVIIFTPEDTRVWEIFLLKKPQVLKNN